MNTWRIVVGGALERLRELDAGSVQTCVTSPPYFGLRDYGTGSWAGGDEGCDHKQETSVHQDSTSTLGVPADGGPRRIGEENATVVGKGVYRGVCGKCGATRTDSQLGLEATPDEYVARLVEVFREVRRVLRDDGTLWLNLGSAYFGAPTTGGCSPKSTLTGGGGKYRSGSKNEMMFSAASGGSDPSQSHQPTRAHAYGSDGTAPQDSPGPDSACPDLCDGCRAATQSHHAHSGCSDPLPAQGAQPPSLTDRDSGPPGSGPAPLDASPPDAQVSTTPQSSEPPPGECSHCSNCGACLAVLRSSSRDARRCARTAEYTNGSAPIGSEPHNQDTDALGTAWVNYTRRLKPKDLIPTPWMVAMALQADGWYLRCDIVWNKPNPMPESVTDRPTKAHEYVFLLSKSPRYFYDAEAVAEDSTYGEHHAKYQGTYTRHKVEALQEEGALNGDQYQVGLRRPAINPHRRNKRSVWTVATAPFPGAHFAVFPPKLIEPCVLAGSAEGTTVLDPFAGAGTTGLVATRLGRSFIGIELNPEYAEMARDRIRDDAPLMNYLIEAS